MATDNIAIARRWFQEVWNDRREATIDELVLPNGVCHADDGPITGPEEFKDRLWKPFLAAFPDIRVSVEDVLSCGDQVVVRWTASGKHTGKGLGVEPTAQQAMFNGMTWTRYENGKMVEGWQSSNIPEVVRVMKSAG